MRADYTWKASNRSVITIHWTLIRPILENGDIITFATTSKTSLVKRTSIQTEALMLCCGEANGMTACVFKSDCDKILWCLSYMQNAMKFGLKKPRPNSIGF